MGGWLDGLAGHEELRKLSWTQIAPVTEPRIVPFLVSELRLPPQERELLGREWWPSYAHYVIYRDGVLRRQRPARPVGHRRAGHHP